MVSSYQCMLMVLGFERDVVTELTYAMLLMMLSLINFAILSWYLMWFTVTWCLCLETRLSFFAYQDQDLLLSQLIIIIFTTILIPFPNSLNFRVCNNCVVSEIILKNKMYGRNN